MSIYFDTMLPDAALQRLHSADKDAVNGQNSDESVIIEK